MPVVEGEAVQAIAQYVRARRGGLTVAEAARRAGLSARKWHQIEAGQGHHRETTLVRVAEGLGESPRQLFELAGLPWAEGAAPPRELPERVSDLEARLDAVEQSVDAILDRLGGPE